MKANNVLPSIQFFYYNLMQPRDKSTIIKTQRQHDLCGPIHKQMTLMIRVIMTLMTLINFKSNRATESTLPELEVPCQCTITVI